MISAYTNPDLPPMLAPESMPDQPGMSPQSKVAMAMMMQMMGKQMQGTGGQRPAPRPQHAALDIYGQPLMGGLR